MAIEKVITIKGDTEDAQKGFKDLGSIIQEQKDITIEFEKELVKLEKQLNETAKTNLPAQKALKDRIVGLKDAIKDQRVSLKSLNNEKRKQVKEDNLTLEGVTKNYGAITLLDQVTNGYASSVRNAVDGVRLFNKTLKGTRTALIATGIGAFVVALGLVVAYWDDIVDLITDANGKLEEQKELIESTGSLLESQLATVNKQIELNKLQGKGNEEIQKQQIAILKQIQEQNIALREKLEEQLFNLKATQLEVGYWDTIKANILFAAFGTKALASEAASLAAQRLKEIAALEAAISQQKAKEIDLEIQLFNAANGGGTEKREKVSGIGKFSKKIQEETDAKEAARFAEAEAVLQHNLSLEKIVETSARYQSDTQIKWAELTAEAKLGIASAVLQDAAKLVDQNSVAGKGIAIAQTGINTAQGIMQAFATLPTIAAIPAAAIVGALGIKSTIDIVKQKIPSATGRGFVSGGDGGGASAAPAPAFNLVEGTSDSQINDSINLQNQEPVRAVVVSGDVTTSQSVDRNIVTESGL